MRLTLFDLDHTLLSGDSDFEWGQFLAVLGVVDRASHERRNRAFYEDYKAGTLDIEAFLAFQLEPLKSFPRHQLDRWHQQFMAQRIMPLIGPLARQKVADEQARSDLVAIVTATNRFVTAPIALAFGIEHLIATEPDTDPQGEFTGRVRGIPSFRAGKIARVDEWLASLGRHWDEFDATAFYSDSMNDLPLLERVTEPVAVNPDNALEALARAQHWPILNWMGS